ncbi:MAG: hypothetical protein ACXV5Q_00750 [Frankiaceae bacterium]
MIEFAAEVLEMDLLPWQKWLAIHALELLPDGSFRFRTVVLLVGRQNGKSTFLQVLALFFMFIRGVALVIGTAQNLDIAEEVWQGAVDIAQDVPDLAAEIERVTMVNGKKALELRQGERYKVQAANRRGGRGLSGDLVMLDELREHQSWDAWGAVTKTTMARRHAQVWAASNAGDRTSVVLDFLRRLAHLALSDPDDLGPDPEAPPSDVLDEADDESLGLFEWSAPPGCDVRDRDGWAQANPSLGYTITERAIASALRTDPEAVFRTEVLCQWVDRVRPPAFAPDIWSSSADATAEQGPSPVFAVATAPDRSWSAIGAAWTRPDGRVQVSLVDYRPDTGWVKAACERIGARSPLVDKASRGLLDNAVEPSQEEQAIAHNALYDALLTDRIRHDDLPALNMAVRSSQWRPMGDSRVLDRKGDTDISPLIAVALAAHALQTSGPSVYEERGLLIF